MSDGTLFWSGGNLLCALGNARWRLFQPSTRRNLVVCSAVLPLFDRLATAVDGLSRTTFESEVPDDCRMLDVTTFTPFENAMSNGDMFDREAAINDQLSHVSATELIELLVEGGYIGYSKPFHREFTKQGFGDRFKGNFYEQVGTECLMNRVDPTTWWVNQKFAPGHTETKPTPYKFVEEYFLEGYFEREMSNQRVLEVGCGTGFYTHKIARHATTAVGVDYNADYIETAKNTVPEDCDRAAEFAVCNIIDMESDRPDLTQAKYDRIILIDIFLFLFDQIYQQALYDNKEKILRNIAHLLDKSGKLIIVDPHPFWLSAMMGDDEYPVAVIDAYRSRRLRVIPPLSEISSLFFDSGLRIVRILEPDVDEAFRAIDPKTYHFYKEFPAWWVFELENAGGDQGK